MREILAFLIWFFAWIAFVFPHTTGNVAAKWVNDVTAGYNEVRK